MGEGGLCFSRRGRGQSTAAQDPTPAVGYVRQRLRDWRTPPTATCSATPFGLDKNIQTSRLTSHEHCASRKGVALLLNLPEGRAFCGTSNVQDPRAASLARGVTESVAEAVAHSA